MTGAEPRALGDDARDDVGRGAALAEPVRLARAVVVARPGDREAEAARELAQARLRVGAVLGVVDLEAEEPGVDEPLEALGRDDALGAARARVREHGHAAGGADEAHAGERVGRVVRLRVARARVQDAGERRRPRRHVPARHERVGDVRAADRGALGGLGEHVVPAERVVAPDAPHDLLGAREPRLADAGGLGEEALVERVDQVGEHVHAHEALARRELHAGDERDAGRRARRPRPRPSRSSSRGR